jgi:hypothetical protein
LRLIPHLLHLMQLDRPLVLPLELAQHIDLAASDLVALQRALLSIEGRMSRTKAFATATGSSIGLLGMSKGLARKHRMANLISAP